MPLFGYELPLLLLFLFPFYSLENECANETSNFEPERSISRDSSETEQTRDVKNLSLEIGQTVHTTVKDVIFSPFEQ